MYNQYIQLLKPNISYGRHHVYKKTENGKDIELQEVGPRFEMKSEYQYNCTCISSEIE